MRYTFQQLLEYQNKRNAECDQSKVDDVVDEVLALLENEVYCHPTAKHLKIFSFSQKKNEWRSYMATLTQTERNKVIEALSDLGFKELKFVIDNKDNTMYLDINWGQDV